MRSLTVNEKCSISSLAYVRIRTRIRRTNSAFLFYSTQSTYIFLTSASNGTTLTSLDDSGVFLLKPAMKELQDTFDRMGGNGPALLVQTVQSIRTSPQSGLRIVFLIGAGTMLLAFLFILAIPEISIDVEVKDEKTPESLEKSTAC